MKKQKQLTDWEEMFATNTTNKGLISKLYQQLI